MKKLTKIWLIIGIIVTVAAAAAAVFFWIRRNVTVEITRDEEASPEAECAPEAEECAAQTA